jgi:A1 cistron-splicing factor AAR2
LYSQQLEELLSSEYEQDWKELMGEFQLTFVLFLLLSSFSALEQWKKVSFSLSTNCNPLSAAAIHFN